MKKYLGIFVTVSILLSCAAIGATLRTQIGPGVWFDDNGTGSTDVNSAQKTKALYGAAVASAVSTLTSTTVPALIATELEKRPRIISFQASAIGSVTWTDMPAAATIINSTAPSSASRAVHRADLRGFNKCRLIVSTGNVLGSTGAKLIARYALVSSTTAADYSDLGTSEISVPIDTTTNTNYASAFINLVPAAKVQDAILTIIGTGGNGTADPLIGVVDIECK